MNEKELSPVVAEISFEVIKSFWAAHLWPGRNSEIEAVSCITSEGQISLDLRKFSPLFFGVFSAENLVGVVSSCQTSSSEIRLRGICVLSEYRNHGLAKMLVKAAFQKNSTISDVSEFWTLARAVNEVFYMQLGFSTYKKIEGFEYGPHFVMKNKQWRLS